MAAACASISIAVPVVRTASLRSLNCSKEQRVGIAAAFSSLTFKSGDHAGNKQWSKQWPKQRIKATQGGTLIRLGRDTGPVLCFGSNGEGIQKNSGVPQEILEDSKFVPINNDDPRFGPPAMLLLGFSDDDVTLASEMIQNMGGDFMQVLVCTEEMLDGTLNQALNATQPALAQIKKVKGVPQVCFLSGLTGEELMMVVHAFPEIGLKGIAFAAHVPKNSQTPMRELIGEIMGDHEKLSKSRQPRQPSQS